MCLPLKKGRFVRAALRSIISIIMDLCDSQRKIPAAMATVGEVATIEPQLQLDVVHGPKECKECKELQTAEALTDSLDPQGLLHPLRGVHYQ